MKKILGLLLALCLTAQAWAAITIDGTPVTATAIASSSLSANYTTGAGTLRFLVVAFSAVKDGAGSVKGVSVGSQTLTLIKAFSQGGANIADTEFWGITNPAASTYLTITATLNSAAGNAVMGVVDYAGVNQDAPTGAFGGTGTTSSPNNVTITPTFPASWIFDLNSVLDSVTGAMTFDAKITSRWNDDVVASLIVGAAGDTTQTGAAFVSLTNTASGTITNWAHLAVELLAPTSTPTNTRTFTATPTSTVTSTFTASPTPTFTVSPTPTSTSTATPSPTPTSTATPTATATPSPTPTSTATPTATVSPTPTSTVTPVCVTTGEQTPGTTPVTAWTKCFLKPVTIVGAKHLCAINIYVTATAGSLMAGIYETSTFVPHLVAVSKVYAAILGWNQIYLKTANLSTGNYLIAVEASNSIQISSVLPGQDQVAWSQWGLFKSFINPTNLYRDHSINAVFCTY